MGRRRLRLGIRAQLTMVLLLGALLSTGATLFIANNAIQQYALQQTHTQEEQSMKIALLVLQTQYGQNVSVSSDGQLVTDSPTTQRDLTGYASSDYGKYPLNNDVNYVDQVQQLIGGFVSVYQCANAMGPSGSCTRIASTLLSTSGNATTQAADNGRQLGVALESTPAQNMGLTSASPSEWLGVVSYSGESYYTDYYPLLNPQQRLIGVLAVGVPLDTVTAFQRSTTIQLLLLGLIIMIAGVIFALLFASTIITTLQNVARQVISASERIGAIASQQAGGSQQQVWAVNSINKALQNFAETTRDISHRTDQLAQMGSQVIQKRAEISPMQIDSILAYITRSVRDISKASQQESQQYDRMTGAMQAVIEIAEQVAAGSQQATDSAQRLDEVIVDLQRIVGVQRIRAAQESPLGDYEPAMADMGGMGGMGQIMSQPSMGGYSMGQMGGYSMGQMAPMGARAGVRSDQNLRFGGGQYMGRMPSTAADLSASAMGQMGPMGGQMGGMGPMGGQMGGQMGNPYGMPGRAPASGALRRQMGQMGPMGGQMGGMNGMNGMGGMGGQMGMGPMSNASDKLPPLGPPQGMSGMGGMPAMPGMPGASGGRGGISGMHRYEPMNPVSGPMDGGPFGGRRSFGDDATGGEMSLPMPPLPDYPTGGANGYMGPSRPDVSAPPARTRGMRGPVSGSRQGGPNANGAPTNSRLPDWQQQQQYGQDADAPYGRGYGE